MSTEAEATKFDVGAIGRVVMEAFVRIPIIPARDSDLIPATHCDPFPAT